MSIVAVKIDKDYIEIGSDSIIVSDATQDKGTNKYHKLLKISDDYIIGSVGLCEECSLFQLFCNTRKPEQSTELSILHFISDFAGWKNIKTQNYSIKNHFIIVFNNRVFRIQGFFVQEIVNFDAIGAGRDFALTALHLGHDVETAIEIACELSIYCEKPIKKFKVNL